MVTSHVTRITLVTRYLIGRFNLRTSWTRVLHVTFQNNKLKKGRWSWISNCSEAFHTDSWLAEANPGHSDRDVILQALLPGPRYGSTLGPGKARMGDSGLAWCCCLQLEPVKVSTLALKPVTSSHLTLYYNLTPDLTLQHTSSHICSLSECSLTHFSFFYIYKVSMSQLSLSKMFMPTVRRGSGHIVLYFHPCRGLNVGLKFSLCICSWHMKTLILLMSHSSVCLYWSSCLVGNTLMPWTLRTWQVIETKWSGWHNFTC